MAYRRRYSRRSPYHSSAGLEAAKKHIEEAEALSRELGGTDKDVKSYFFSLKDSQLKQILDEYQKQYGRVKREYAEEALPYWKSGRRKMSGLVAGRLFKLLPHHMPVDKKFELVESLWRFKQPSSSRKMYVGPDADAEELTSKVREHLNEKVRSYTIDDSTSKRFGWLAGKDSKLCQDLRNHFLHLEKQQLSNASFDRIGVMIAQVQRTDLSQSLMQTFEVGKHKVELHFHADSKGISDVPPQRPFFKASQSNPGERPWGCFLILASPIVVFILFLLDGL